MRPMVPASNASISRPTAFPRSSKSTRSDDVIFFVRATFTLVRRVPTRMRRCDADSDADRRC